MSAFRFAAATAALLTCSMSLAQAQIQIGKIAGRAEVRAKGSEAWAAADQGTTVNAGDSVRVSGGSATLALPRKGRVVLGDGGALTVIPGRPLGLLPHPHENLRTAVLASDPATAALNADAASADPAADETAAKAILSEAQQPGQLIHASDQDLQALDPGSARAVGEMRSALSPTQADGRVGLTPEMRRALRQAVSNSPHGSTPETDAVIEKLGDAQSQ